MKLRLCGECVIANGNNDFQRNHVRRLFYLSSVNPELKQHFELLAQTLKDKKFVIDVGSNDGVLLSPQALGVKNIGIDPSVNVGAIANKNGLKTLIGFFDKDTAEEAIAFGGRPTVSLRQAFSLI